MAIEKERKFLVNQMVDEFKEIVKLKERGSKHLIQMYLSIQKDHHIRLRIENGNTAYIAYKKDISKTDREEIEFQVNLYQAVQTFEKKDYICYLEKTRVKHWDIDFYTNGLVVCEYEYSKDIPFPKTLPKWVGDEITGVEEYTNIYIAQNYEKFS